MAVISPGEARDRVFDVIIVGAGAAGAAVAQTCAGAGHSVLLVEEGGMSLPNDGPDPNAEHEIPSSSPHDPRAMTNCIAVGGALHRWGGRCVPFDPEDFGPRRLTSEPGWPIDYDDYARWVAPAAEFLETDPVFTTPPPAGWEGQDHLRADRVERLNALHQLSHLQDTLSAPGIALLTKVAVVELLVETGGGRAKLTGLTASDGTTRFGLRAGRVVLACGGLETTRLLLLARRAHPEAFGGEDGALGRYYMGHLTGSVARFTFQNPADIAAFRYAENGLASPARRRIMLTTADLPSVAFWLENSAIEDPRHRSGELSAKHLLGGGDRFHGFGGHLRNIVADPKGMLEGLGAALRRRRHPERRHPDRLTAKGGDLRLAYHAEHLPLSDSRVRLAETEDRFGRPKLRIDFVYGDATVDGVVAAHRQLSDALAGAGLATVVPAGDGAALKEQVIAQARDGYHQIGLTRMSANPTNGVVDADCKLHGVDNLFVASGSVFPVSGQANPTLSVVAFALRLGAHLAKLPKEV
ncbi:MAG: GMC oxidoreductase [Rhodobacteraceae bacterium]|nr:GMC oxidoreductase [Paracoccaceae bacterium]